MFRSFIYLDEDKLYTYKRQIEGANSAKPKSMTQKKSTGFSAGAKGMGVTGSTETSLNSEFEKDVSFDYDRFELLLQDLDGEDYFDCAVNDDYDLTTIPGMKIIRVYDSLNIPEEFDLINAFAQYKPMLIDRIEAKNAQDQQAIESIMNEATADIPVIIETDDIIISSKLNEKYLLEELAMLEDYADHDVYMLCKVVGVTRRDKVEIFDPLKDFVRLPRAMRRQIGSNGHPAGFEKIIVDGPVLKVEIIAIYK